jgi:hypothetical protein
MALVLYLPDLAEHDFTGREHGREGGCTGNGAELEWRTVTWGREEAERTVGSRRTATQGRREWERANRQHCARNTGASRVNSVTGAFLRNCPWRISNGTEPKSKFN